MPWMLRPVIKTAKFGAKTCIMADTKQKNAPMRMEARRPILSQTVEAAKAAKNAVMFRHATVIPMIATRGRQVESSIHDHEEEKGGNTGDQDAPIRYSLTPVSLCAMFSKVMSCTPYMRLRKLG